MNITSVVVSAAMMGTLLPAVTTMSLSPAIAGKRAVNFSQAEANAVTVAASAEKANSAPAAADLPTGCSYTRQEDPVYTVECRHGTDTPFEQVVERTFRLEIAGRDSLPVTTDDDLDGFDDVSGMPTHYFECYSGWKGVSDNKALKNNCELGGAYVIPAYAHLYD
jgi:hypothetical protein